MTVTSDIIKNKSHRYKKLSGHVFQRSRSGYGLQTD